MPRVRRILLPLLLLSAPLPLAAQPANVVTPTPPPREGTVGPEQLRDFALPGTRTQPSEPQADSAPAERPAAAAPRTPAPTQERPAPTARVTREEPAASQPAARAETQGVPSTSAQAPVELPPPTPAIPQNRELTAAPPLSADPEPITPAPVSTAESFDFNVGWWPWALAAALGGVALFMALRRRTREQDVGRLAFVGLTSGAGSDPAPPHAPPETEPSPAPAPKPDPLPAGLITTRLNKPAADSFIPGAPAAAPAPAPVGLVSSRLRPWLELEIAVLGVTLTDSEAIIQFELDLANSGSVPARDIVVEVLPLNGGEEQEEQIAAFFGGAMKSSQGIAAIPPLDRVNLRNEVRMPLTAIREYAVEGARVFVPVLAFNGAYRWSGGEGRTSAAWLVGRAANGSGKLGPLRLDQGPRQFSGTSQKRLELAVRR